MNNVHTEREGRGCPKKTEGILRKLSLRLGLNIDPHLSTELRDLAKCTKMANEEMAAAAAATVVGGEAESALSRNSVTTAVGGASTTASPAPAISDAVKKRMRFVVSLSVQKGQNELY